MTSPDRAHRVLVMGYRQGLCDALSRLKIPHAIWSEKELKNLRSVLHLHVEKFPRVHQRIVEILKYFAGAGPFTHVIAGTEAAVYSASVARRILHARVSINSVAMRCHDKLHMKTFLRERNIPMTDFIPGEEIQEATEVIERLGTPVVVKMRHESGGRGIQLVKTPDDVIRFAGRNRIMERFVSAPEASVECFINNNQILFENITQYYVKKHINIVPGLLSSSQKQALLELNQQIIKALKIKWGMTHMEAYLSDQGILFGEIALRPPGGYIMELISKAYGFSSWEALVHMELDIPFTFPVSRNAFSAAYIIHPGAGKVQQINGWKESAELPSVYKAKLKIEPGAIINKRLGVGEDAGYLLLANNNKQTLVHDLETISDTLQFSLE